MLRLELGSSPRKKCKDNQEREKSQKCNNSYLWREAEAPVADIVTKVAMLVNISYVVQQADFELQNV